MANDLTAWPPADDRSYFDDQAFWLPQRARALAAAVVSHAVDDLKSNDPAKREQAVLFLTAEEGEWAESRRLWCAGLDLLDPDVLRERALAEFQSLPGLMPKPKQRKPTGAEMAAERKAAIEAAGFDWTTCTVAEVETAFKRAGIRVGDPRPWLCQQRTAAGLPPPPRRPRVNHMPFVRRAPPKPEAPKPEPVPSVTERRFAALAAAGLDLATCEAAEALAAFERAGLGMSLQIRQPVTIKIAKDWLAYQRKRAGIEKPKRERVVKPKRERIAKPPKAPKPPKPPKPPKVVKPRVGEVRVAALAAAGVDWRTATPKEVFATLLDAGIGNIAGQPLTRDAVSVWLGEKRKRAGLPTKSSFSVPSAHRWASLNSRRLALFLEAGIDWRACEIEAALALIHEAGLGRRDGSPMTPHDFAVWRGDMRNAERKRMAAPFDDGAASCAMAA